ncbi:TonB-dependent receptor [Pontixanthobacter aestiaquae]|uniref:TonB-dependent receptor n=1 Tax=Pontixanthobacter aestiaquae TaxID=1509367 RepID=A0A844Z5S2_9SPHN|nr:TonB-dependent receptor [Pontixanthobacter aestiaquae]MDN3646164.1 TonB-dependent receptor [Pontixanthobacter aestiaquae]MXO82844.1 TonB-dependent receptor [Pontixanthobacter aestiaquae]
MRFTNRRLICSLLAGTAALAFTAAPAVAQDTDGTEAAEAGSGDPIITVTARRREERIVDVPLSITAISGDELAKTGTLELTEIGQKVPNLTLEVSRGTNTTLTAFIRGVGQQDPVAGFEAGVGLYVDDVYINRPQAAVLDIYDVERIEVLRGPQGTLYGRNTIGGAIKYVTRRLPDDVELKVRGTYGSYDQADLVVSGSAPLTDSLKFGASAARLSRGGFGDNLNLAGVENYNKDVWAGRATLEFDNGPVFARLSGDYVKDNSEARQGFRLIPGLLTGAPVLDDVYDTRAGLNVVDQEVEAFGGALNIAVEVSDTITLKSITGYREDKSTTPIDFDSLPAADLDVPAIYENDQFSQEFQLLYESDNFNGVIGAYYLDANAFTAFDVALFTTGDLLFLLDPTTDLRGLNAQTLGDVNTKTWSIFGDFTYDISEQLSISLGGRYTSDKRTSRVLRTSFVGGFSNLFGGSGVPFAVTSDFNGSQTFEEFTPRASISYKPTENHNIYFTYSRGFKGGGFDPRGQTSAAPDLDGDGDIDFDDQFRFLSFDPETVDSYELGWKASLLDNRLNIAVAAFKGDYTDIQIPGSVGFDTTGNGVNDSFIGITSNAGEADVNGFEFEGNALVGKDFAGAGSRFNVNWSLGYVDATYKQFIDAFGVDVADQRVFQNTPEFTVSAGFDLGLPVANGIVDLIGGVSMRSDASQFETPNAFLDQDGFVLLDASIVYTADSDRWSIGVHGKNLTDKRYIVAGYNFVAGGTNGVPFAPTLGLEGTLTGFYGDPRRVFVTGEFRF